ncbi:hypothetical protein LNKW23_42220 [Paralimibaculum aggregatum]|uniref:Lipoprotein n=1 Tax=Paralimibaculum aggregatum TaxID=3036245 RepID=A0ABQ6LSG8_9RHOB|nr:hypothetical protein [Limibaculum sp. NKW23]GMG85006.1 hypothetical protein LNKW23_42220 [Limibaculum sp. NKW23]
MTFTRFAAVAAMTLALALAGCRSAPLLDIKGAPYGAATSYQRLSYRDYENAIIRAGTKRNWVFRRIGQGHLEGSLTVRGKHNAVVDIYFDTESFSIIHKASSGLDYNPGQGTIHSNYNAWIQNLENDIRAEVQLLRAS